MLAFYMSQPINELVFDLLLVAATAIAFTTYMLGIMVDPIPGLTLGVILVGIGLIASVPRQKWTVAALSGVFGVLIAGVIVPRFITQFTGVTDKLSLSLFVTGIILLLTIALLHITAFKRLTPQTPRNTSA